MALFVTSQRVNCEFFKGNVGMSTYTKLFKAKVCRGVEYPENCKTNEDKYFCFLAALNSNTFSSKSVAKYTYYRREGSSSITEFTEKYLDCICQFFQTLFATDFLQLSEYTNLCI